MNRKQIKPDTQAQTKNLAQAEYQKDSLACSDSPLQSQRLSAHLQPSTANATHLSGLHKRNKPSNDSHKKERQNSNGQRDYLCEYSYEGKRWSLTIMAASQDDAEARLKRLAYGKVIGELKATIPVKYGWIAKAMVFLRNIAT